MVVAIFVRRLKEGLTFADFKAAWEAERGFGVPARVIAAQDLEDPREILTVAAQDEFVCPGRRFRVEQC